jgi:ATP-dependent DNA helicase RecG
MKTAKELFEQLNNQDESTEVEAKPGSKVTHTILETICAFCNEPSLGGGYILLGAIEEQDSLFPQYASQHITDPDKIQSDLASQCNIMFNIPVRPIISTEKINEDTVVVVKINELPANQKPLYFKSKGLPDGAYRRIGPTDHRCTYDDLQLFFTDYDSYDKTILNDTSISDIDESAISRYRELRARINPSAEELSYSDEDLLMALGCIETKESKRLTVAGLLLFGKSQAQRRNTPMLRTDYIRVPGTTWVEDPDNRFTTIDMRGSLILLAFRLVDAVNADLPKGFLLPEGSMQADATGLPVKALREAIVNAIMHRSYRENSPIQIIRYDNRLEIINPGFSLKSEDTLGQPGSQTRNPLIAAAFHETNLAETKGSGIRAMRKLLQQAHLAPPTFESNRERNVFTVRLLLHHFLNPSDLEWLSFFDSFNLNDAQKQALIFTREVGAIDNSSYRQIADLDVYKSNIDLRQLKDYGFISQQGKGRGTYYLPTVKITGEAKDNTEASALNTEAIILNTDASATINTEATALNTEASTLNTEALIKELPISIKEAISNLKVKERDKEKVCKVIESICGIKPYELKQLASILRKNENWVSRQYIKPLIDQGRLNYLYTEMKNHPEQAYLTVNKK